MKRIITIFLVIALNFSLAFDVVDEGSVIEIKSGESLIKYISLYNFEADVEQVTVDYYLAQYPDENMPEYKIGLVKTTQSEIVLEKNKKHIYPVNISARRSLPKGRYSYWFKFSKIESTSDKESVKYQKNIVYNVPLIIDVR